MSETTAHEALADFLHRVAAPRLPRLTYAWHTPNEANAGGSTIATTKGRVPVEALKNARMGVVKGVWDWLLIGENQLPIEDERVYAGLAVELKSIRAYRDKDHGLSTEQLTWGSYYRLHGWYTAVFPENDWVGAAHLFVRWAGGRIEDFNFGGWAGR